MKFGACIDWRSRSALNDAKAAGADFAEFGLSSFMDADTEQIAELAEFLKEIDLPCLSYNLMLPGGNRVVGPDKNYENAAKDVDTLLEKISVLGARNIVFGSCGARNLKDGMDKETAFSEFVEFVSRWLAPVLEKHGFICTIEPLSECNLIHTVCDGAKAARLASHPNVKLLYDFYHVWKNDEPIETLESNCDLLNHVHVASVSQNRTVPRRGDGDEQRYIEMFKILKNGGYDKAVSLEGGYITDNYQEEMKSALDYLRECCDKA